VEDASVGGAQTNGKWKIEKSGKFSDGVKNNGLLEIGMSLTAAHLGMEIADETTRRTFSR
jgi:hypothetical protein